MVTSTILLKTLVTGRLSAGLLYALPSKKSGRGNLISHHRHVYGLGSHIDRHLGKNVLQV